MYNGFYSSNALACTTQQSLLVRVRPLTSLHVFPFSCTDALIKDINTDKLVSLRSVDRPAYSSFKSDAFFSRPSQLEPPESDPAAVRVKPGESVADKK